MITAIIIYVALCIVFYYVAKTKKALDFIDNANRFRTIILGLLLAFYLPFIGLYHFYYWNFRRTKF